MPIDMSERTWNANMAAELRKNDGKVTSGPLAGSDLLLLGTVGAKSGETRVSPLGYRRDGARYVVVGSNSGRDWHPAWLRNIEKTPEVTIEVGGEAMRARATVETGAERRRLLDAHIARIPIFAQYEAKTERPLPVVTLTPEADSRAEPSASSWEDALIADLRANGGRPSSGPLAGHPLMIVGTVGTRSGEPRRAILTYSRDGADYIVAGTNGGAPTDPAWVANMRAHPGLTVEVDNEAFDATATVLTSGTERDRLWAQHAAELPWFADYPEKSGRIIPMVRIARAAG
jgi:deazaflavin-dependent oxidoreductase (nitroreductase family)